VDRQWREKAVDRLRRHRQSDHGKHDRARVTTEDANLACAEGESRIVCMPSRELVRERGHDEGNGMRAHVPAICQQRHRMRENAGSDLQHHHYNRNENHGPGAPLGP
jgi:hypothetical protein